jgi:hypothetical protein
MSHSFTRQQLHASVTGGCRFCNFLLRNVVPETYGESLRVEFSLSGRDDVNPRKINSAVVHVTGLSQYAQRLLHISVFTRPGVSSFPLTMSRRHVDKGIQDR